jgi:hypothetical protein
MLRQLVPGSDVVIKDEKGQVMFRGTLNKDRVSLTDADGGRIPIMPKKGWQVVVLRRRGSAGGRRKSRAQ